MSLLRNGLIVAVLTLCLAGTARADFLYSFDSSAASFPSVDFKFIVPSLLNVTTTIAQIDLFDVVYHVADETLDTVDMIDPEDAMPQIQVNFPGGGSLASVLYFNWPGPFDHVGSYTHPGGSILTISEAAATPEPTSLMLLATALGGVWFVRSRVRR